MRRTAYSIPDAINCSVSRNFTQVPNDLLKNPNISGKAKAILCVLLSNKDGWKTYFASLKGVMKEGTESLRAGLRELEEYGYLRLIQCRRMDTKQFVGKLWLYTDAPGLFNLEEHIKTLENKGFELLLSENSRTSENPSLGKPESRKTRPRKTRTSALYNMNILKNTNDKNTKEEKNTNGRRGKAFSASDSESESSSCQQKIIPSQFGEFWNLYPKKVDKGKALTSWERLCRKPKNQRPSLPDIVDAISAQNQTDRWRKGYIPMPSTWLNQQRWLDDPNEMQDWNKKPGNGNGNSNRMGYSGNYGDISINRFSMSDFVRRKESNSVTN